MARGSRRSVRTRRIPFTASLVVGAAAALVAGAALASAPRGGGQDTVPGGAADASFAAGRLALERARSLRAQGDRARNVILFVGDGMGVSTVTAARILEGQFRGEPGEENLLAFERLPYVALAKTYSVNQQVAESSATMTALVTGAKTKDDLVSLSREAVPGDHTTSAGRELTTLLEHAERAGLATGVVTTARLTHATPAATYAHTVHRNWEDDASTPEEARRAGYRDIARQLVELPDGDGLDVALGGGRSWFLPATMADPEYPERRGRRRDGRDLPAEWVARRPAAQWVWNRAQFDAIEPARTSRLLGLFEPSHMQYEADRAADPGGEPSLAEMTAKAIAILERNRRGYVLVVEGGRIDLAHHSGNAYRALTDTIAFSGAVREALARTNARDTLVVVTADHSHTLTIAGYPARGNPILGKVRGTAANGLPAAAAALDLLGRPYTTLSYANGPGHPGASNQQPEGAKRFPHAPASARPSAAGRPDLTSHDTEAADYLQEGMVPFANETHAGEDVAIYAGGPAAHLLHGVVEQHLVFHVMAHALRLPR